MWDEHLLDWMTTYGRNGSGSTSLRANGIKGIYNDTLPIPVGFEAQKKAVNKNL